MKQKEKKNFLAPRIVEKKLKKLIELLIFAYLRLPAKVDDNVKIGNFLRPRSEIKVSFTRH